MKKLIIMRHAKSDWSNRNQTDHQRTLNTRGKKDAPAMAQELVKRNTIPQLALVSDAMRTRETWALMQEYLPHTEVKFLRDLYLAEPSEITHQIEQVGSSAETVLVLAHNPGITDVYYHLGKIRIDNVPTAGVGCFACDINSFSELSTQLHSLEYFIYPKGL